MKYYAVKKGKHPGIYTTWKDCQKEIDHFKDAKFKSFDAKKEALAYLKQKNQKRFYNRNVSDDACIGGCSGRCTGSYLEEEQNRMVVGRG